MISTLKSWVFLKKWLVNPGELEPSQKEKYDALRKEIPMQISVAEPSSVGTE